MNISKNITGLLVGAPLFVASTLTAMASPEAIIDSYACFSREWADIVGSEEAARAAIIQAYSLQNDAHARSRTGLRINPIGLEMVEVTWNGVAYAQYDTAQFDFLGRRDELGADNMTFFANGYNGGVGFFTQDLNRVTYGGYNLAHETGHNLGAGHGIYDTDGGLPYAKGAAWTGTDGVDYHSIMGQFYFGNRMDSGHFTNPEVMHAGVPTGEVNNRDNARFMRQYKFEKSNRKQINLLAMPNAQWILVNRGSGQPIYSPDNQGGTTLREYFGGGDDRFQWRFQRTWWDWSKFYLINKESGLCMSVGNSSGGGPLIQEVGFPAERLKFSLESLPNGYVKIRGDQGAYVQSNQPYWIWGAPVLSGPNNNSIQMEYELRRVFTSQP